MYMCCPATSIRVPSHTLTARIQYGRAEETRERQYSRSVAWTTSISLSMVTASALATHSPSYVDEGGGSGIQRPWPKRLRPFPNTHTRPPPCRNSSDTTSAFARA